MRRRRVSVTLLMVVAVASNGLLVSCGSDSLSPPTASDTSAQTVVEVGETPLDQSATDNEFGTATYTIAAGQPYTLVLTNAGQAVHDWHVIDVKGSGGKSIETPLVDRDTSTDVTFTIAKPGTYHFQCDVHPKQMTGTLVVQ